MFYPFRKKKDLLYSDNTYWSKFLHEVTNGPANKFFKEKGIEILLNIQSSKSAQRLRQPADPVAQGTKCKPSEGKHYTDDDSDDDIDIDEIEDLVSILNNEYDECDIEGNKGTHKNILQRCQFNKKHIVDAPLISESVLLNETNDNVTNDDVDTADSKNMPLNLDRFPSVIEVVKGSMLFDNPADEIAMEQEDTIHTLAAVAKHANLDDKQQLEFQVI